MPALSKKQQKFFGIVRAIQKGEQVPTTPETAKAAADMKKGDVKKFASTKHKGLPEKKVAKEEYGNPKVGPALKMARLIDKTKPGPKSKRTKISQYLKRREMEGDRKKFAAMGEENNPRIPRKKGQPAGSKKHSDLYTDENPKGTIHGLGFKDVSTAKSSVSKIRNSSRSHAHKIQAAVAMEQRAREMGKTSEAAVYRKFINTMKKKTKSMNEGSLHKWFKGSKSKDGKGGWVNVVTGGTCASDEPGEGTPKCVSSSKRASMSKSERLSAARRKKKADPGQQSKTGAAKPTYVSTDSPRKKKMKEETQLNEVKDKKGKGSGSKDACYHKVKSRYSVWPSAYASGALVKCRKVGAANWGNSSKKEEFEPTGISFQQFQEKCWKGYEKKGMKTMFGKRYPNCVKKEEVEVLDERQKDSDNQRLSQERGRSNYGKASIRNVRATGMGGNAADPAERGAVIDARRKAHKEKRGVKTKGMSEAKVDDKKVFGVTADRNERRFGKKGAFDMQGSGSRGQDPSERAKLAAKRGEEHRARRGVKTKGMKEEVKVPKNVKKIAKELDKAVGLHASQAKRLRKAGISEELTGWRKDLGYEDRDDSKKLLEDDMKGMSVKSGHKRPTKSGAGMTQKGVEAYRRRNPGSKLKTAVTTKPSKLKKGSKAANRRKSYCARSAGQMKKFPKAAKDPNSRLRQARRRWNC